MTNEERIKKLEKARERRGKPWITEIMVEPMKTKPSILNKSQFPFQKGKR